MTALRPNQNVFYEDLGEIFDELPPPLRGLERPRLSLEPMDPEMIPEYMLALQRRVSREADAWNSSATYAPEEEVDEQRADSLVTSAFTFKQ